MGCVMESRTCMLEKSMTLVGSMGLSVGCDELHSRTSTFAVESQNWYRKTCGMAPCQAATQIFADVAPVPNCPGDA